MNKENDAKLYKIVLNGAGDYIDISTADADLFDRFEAGYRQIVDMEEGLPQKYKEINRIYKQPCTEKTIEIVRANVGFREAAIRIIDDIFGEGTLKKYFNKLYKEVPDFMPGTECFIDFYNQMAPVLEKLFERRVDSSEKERIKSMGQYIYFGSHSLGKHKAATNRRKRHRKKK